jgi:hypothetical protein
MGEMPRHDWSVYEMATPGPGSYPGREVGHISCFVGWSLGSVIRSGVSFGTQPLTATHSRSLRSLTVCFRGSLQRGSLSRD